MESALRPVPLCLGERLIVLQIFPGRWWDWIGSGCGRVGRGGTGSEYKLVTVGMLWRPIVAMGLLLLRRAIAVL